MKISKTRPAINYWLLNDINDLPIDISRTSYQSYTIPVTPDCTLPVKLFDRTLIFNRIKEKGIPWLICIAEKNDLVETEATLAPLDWVGAEVTVFPKGPCSHAKSWSLRTSECSLHKCFLDRRGPVRYQLELDKTMEPS